MNNRINVRMHTKRGATIKVSWWHEIRQKASAHRVILCSWQRMGPPGTTVHEFYWYVVVQHLNHWRWRETSTVRHLLQECAKGHLHAEARSLVTGIAIYPDYRCRCYDR